MTHLILPSEDISSRARTRKTPVCSFIIDRKTNNMINRLAKKHDLSRSALVRAAINTIHRDEFGDDQK